MYLLHGDWLGVWRSGADSGSVGCGEHKLPKLLGLLDSRVKAFKGLGLRV